MKTTSVLFEILRRASLFTLFAIAQAGASATVVRNLNTPAGTSTSKQNSAPETTHFSNSGSHQRRQAPLRAAPPIHNKLVHAPEPAAGKVAADLFWVADSRKMDAFLRISKKADVVFIVFIVFWFHGFLGFRARGRTLEFARRSIGA